MPGLEHNPDLLLSAFLRLARKQDDPAEWIESLQSAALTGNSSDVAVILDKMQDQFAGNVSTEGGSTAWLRELSCILIAQLCEAALQRLEAEEAAEEAGTGAAPLGSVRYPDFSKYPCILG